ncbi:forkhead box protein O1 [Callorhinchus milii]|uniref:Forkhead box O4 n=1 Tax=Callorhinchus milii TaxID=7868 RepID=A0A4W3JRS7_CALMI|nr:forkhead box protein O1 [Callorhinchus milii]XP_007892294.1 forkhead box protein O1 [Callorhinchus milii]|eukprot:gi/632936075/ref/XP_007892293.1/ PREDICTED: forkhead box protein O4 [Callorhinchus milii]
MLKTFSSSSILIESIQLSLCSHFYKDMAEEEPKVEIDPDFEPKSRPRSCTWPLPRPDLTVVKPEESASGTPTEEEKTDNADPNAVKSESEAGPNADICSQTGAAGAQRKGTSRRNAWGHQSYADLITKAIESSPDKRLTLSQIYEWMVKSVPYFRDKGDSNSSAGWKNSIRHNLSLHSKFIRVHNEATGKSSWWMLNPEGGKSGKSPRRRAASMDNNSKLIKSKGRAARKKAALQAAQEGSADSPGSQISKWPGSPSSRNNEDSDAWTSFRPRTSSNASTLSTGRLSPILPEQGDLEDEDLCSSLIYPSSSSKLPPTLVEELELIDSLNLMSPSSSVPSQQSLSTGLMQQDSTYVFRQQSTASGSQSSSYGSSFFDSSDLPPVQSHFSGPATLEALLTSDSPTHSDVMMSQIDPVMPQTGGRLNSESLLLLGESTFSPPSEQSKLNQDAHQGKSPGPSAVSVNTNTLPHTLGMLGPQPNANQMPMLKAQLQTPLSQSLPLGLQSSQSSNSSSSISSGGLNVNVENFPRDLDLDMFMESLDCDMDYIIDHDLMDDEGLDFNFDPVTTSPPYSKTTTQSSTHSWVPS